jgi:hypothetical protein
MAAIPPPAGIAMNRPLVLAIAAALLSPKAR